MPAFLHLDMPFMCCMSPTVGEIIKKDQKCRLSHSPKIVNLGISGYRQLNETISQLQVLQRKMVCDKCQKKVGTVITPDPWKTGARNTTESGGRKVNENKALTSSKNRFNPYTTKFETCRICRQKVHQAGSHYCQACAYKKSICAMCGKKLMSTKNYRQSSA